MLKTLSNGLAAIALICGLSFAGCAGSEEAIETPSGNELEQFLADNPDINNAVYEDDELAEE